MILSKDNNPQKDIYYLGAKLIEILISFEKDKVDYFEAYKVMKEKFGTSINLYTLVLDWLYLLGAIKSEKRYIVKCF